MHNTTQNTRISWSLRLPGLCGALCGAFLMLLGLLSACELQDYECRSALDCQRNRFCEEGRCLAIAPSKVERFQPPKEKKVDVLFVIDAHQDMQHAQDKIASNGESFINALLDNDIRHLQIGVLTSDMENPQHQGRLQGPSGTRIINYPNLSKAQVLSTFKQNIHLPPGNQKVQRGLEAMKTALSEHLLADPQANQGFLRDNSILAIVFASKQNDCSHDGKLLRVEGIPEQSQNDLCHLPKTRMLKDPQGNELKDLHGQPIPGQMHHLIPTQNYIDFLKTQEDKGHQVLVSGLLGNPDDRGRTQCVYVTEQERRCGGCQSLDDQLRAAPGFRYLALIETFGETKQWFSLCDTNNYNQAFGSFAQEIIDASYFFALTGTPSFSSENRPQLMVRLINRDETATPVPLAKTNGFHCKEHKHCEGGGLCGPDQRCYGEGWLYYPPESPNQKPRIALSGKTKKASNDAAHIEVSYK